MISNLATWQLKKLGDITKILNGRAYKQAELLEKGPMPVLRVGNLFTNKNRYYSNLNLDEDKYCYKGDLLYARSASFGPFLWEGEKSIYHYHIWKITCSESVDRVFLYWLLLNETEKMKTKGHGVGMLHITKEYMESLKVLLPPLPTQHAIVTRLDEASATIQVAKSAIQDQIDTLDTLWQSSLSKVFEKGGGEMKTINDISKKIQYGYTGKTIEKGIYRYLRITDIQNNHVNRETVPFVDIDQKEAQKYQLNTGDVVFARTGATVGKSFLIHEAGENKIFASYLIRVVPNYDVIQPEFLKYFFQSGLYWAQIFADVVGAAQPNFNGKKLGEVILALPSLKAQQQIVAELDELSRIINNLKTQYQQQLAEYDALRASILDKAFRGELVK